MEQEQMTVKQALEITIKNLERICVPMNQMQNIGFPLSQGISNLREILIAIERAEAVAKEGEKQEPDGEVEPDGSN